MKTLTLLLLLPFALFAQKQDTTKRDTTIRIEMNINQFRALLITIDANIDSKRTAKELTDFISKSARIVQPADKPKKQ